MSKLVKEIVRREAFTTSRWTGGTTEELAIYPPGSLYAERTFEWRASVATIETAESVFTPLPGYNRTLMLLDGELELILEGRGSVRLRPGDNCDFAGERETRSRGLATDFNLIYADGYRAELRLLALPSGQTDELLIIAALENTTQNRFYLVYAVEGTITIATEDAGDATAKLIRLEPGDALVVRVRPGDKAERWRLANAGEEETARAAVAGLLVP
ncbi:HutD family protein [Cohnella sp. AR92]|uniref:HutD/Ves family protein n=1 Tax=Cohnella sp. AR92 TaxID=648716 RepID=UPI000F8DAFCC|nr:HutD family protein [Cohnella sp. AR92]RUS46190.1 hypothetical protein ELR57_14000 [Cohnella sp. AR92]